MGKFARLEKKIKTELKGRLEFGGFRELMSKLSRREAREILIGLLFETEFHADEDVNAIYSLAMEDRELPDDSFVREGYFGICDKLDSIDEMIGSHSKGWKTERMSKLSRSILRLCVYEMMFLDIPHSISINEAVELCKKFDDDKARPFVNGILNSVKNSLEAK